MLKILVKLIPDDSKEAKIIWGHDDDNDEEMIISLNRFLQSEKFKLNFLEYILCMSFKLTDIIDYFQVTFDHFWSE